jgi:hypothetical protein
LKQRYRDQDLGQKLSDQFGIAEEKEKSYDPEIKQLRRDLDLHHEAPEGTHPQQMPATLSPEHHAILSDPTKELDLSKDEHFDAVGVVVPVKGSATDFTVIDSSGKRYTGPLEDDVVQWMPATVGTLSEEEQAARTAAQIEKFWSTKDAIHVGNVTTKEMDKYYVPPSLLGTRNDPKTVKGEKWSNFRTFIMYMAAHKGSGVVNLCVHATPSCIMGCLGLAGQGGMPAQKLARISKAKYFHYDPEGFMEQLHKQIGKEKKAAVRDGKDFAVRLNGTSDVRWEKTLVGDTGKSILELHPDVQFYDYSKYPENQRRDLPDNYHLTYSYTGLPGSMARSVMWDKVGVNSAVVFRDGMPAEFLGRPVVDGDVSDLRFLDPQHVIVGLHAKGKLLLRDEQGNYKQQDEFVYDTPPADVAIPFVHPVPKADVMRNAGEAAIDAVAGNDPKYPAIIKILKKIDKNRTVAERKKLKTDPKGIELSKIYDAAADAEINKVKDNVHPDFPNIAPKAGDLKWKRGNPFLGLNEPTAETPVKGFRLGGIVRPKSNGFLVGINPIRNNNKQKLKGITQ